MVEGKAGMRILVVDDEPQITRVLRTSLQSNGHEVTVAQDGADALEQFMKAQPRAGDYRPGDARRWTASS